jgi:hypothetical protein
MNSLFAKCISRVGKVLAGPGLKLIVVKGEHATKEILPRITPRVESRVRHRESSNARENQYDRSR